MTAPTIPQAKILRLMSLIQVLIREPLTIEGISESLDIHRRNAHRYLRLIDQLGIELKTGTRPTMSRNHKTVKTYYIEQCPCCGREK